MAQYAQRAHDLELARAQLVETKASRLAQTSLGLLAVSIALAGFQLGIGRRFGGDWWFLLVTPAALGIVCLVLAGIQALEIDRVGLYSPGTPEELVRAANSLAAETAAEERGRWYASWTARHKYDALLQARAWFSRSLVALLLAGIVAAASHAASEKTSEPQRTPQVQMSGS